MVEHAGVHVAHGVAASSNDQILENIDYLCWMEKPALSVCGDDTEVTERIPTENILVEVSRRRNVATNLTIRERHANNTLRGRNVKTKRKESRQWKKP